MKFFECLTSRFGHSRRKQPRSTLKISRSTSHILVKFLFWGGKNEIKFFLSFFFSKALSNQRKSKIFFKIQRVKKMLALTFDVIDNTARIQKQKRSKGGNTSRKLEFTPCFDFHRFDLLKQFKRPSRKHSVSISQGGATISYVSLSNCIKVR